LKRAWSWLQPYGPFMLARYRHLRPQPNPGDRCSADLCKAGEMAAQEFWEQWHARIAQNQDTAVCLKGLNSEQRNQLAALLIETLVAFEERKPQAAGSRLRRSLAAEAKRRMRVLDRKLKKARDAVQELEHYAN